MEGQVRFEKEIKMIFFFLKFISYFFLRPGR